MFFFPSHWSSKVFWSLRKPFLVYRHTILNAPDLVLPRKTLSVYHSRKYRLWSKQYVSVTLYLLILIITLWNIYYNYSTQLLRAHDMLGDLGAVFLLYSWENQSSEKDSDLCPHTAPVPPGCPCHPGLGFRGASRICPPSLLEWPSCDSQSTERMPWPFHWFPIRERHKFTGIQMKLKLWSPSLVCPLQGPREGP